MAHTHVWNELHEHTHTHSTSQYMCWHPNPALERGLERTLFQDSRGSGGEERSSLTTVAFEWGFGWWFHKECSSEQQWTPGPSFSSSQVIYSAGGICPQKAPPPETWFICQSIIDRTRSAFLLTQAHTPVLLLSHIHSYTPPPLSVMSGFCMINHVSGYLHPHKLINCIINSISLADDYLQKHVTTKGLLESKIYTAIESMLRLTCSSANNRTFNIIHLCTSFRQNCFYANKKIMFLLNG